MGQSPSSKNYTDNPNDWILIQGNADLKNGKVAPRLYTSQVTKKADIGDIILTVRAPVGEVAITDYKAILGRGVASIKGNLFIYFALEKFKTNNKWNMYSSGSIFDSITGKDLNNLSLFFPSKMEENKIGELLNKLDSLLALYDRKLKLLSQVKKYFLDNLFTEKECPNLRFTGFTDAWEQRKLNSVFETVSKKGFSNLPVLTATQTKGMIYRNNSGIDIKFNENTLNNYKLVEPNQFVVHLRSFQGGLAASSLRGIASPAYTVLNFKDNKQEVSFWKEFFRSKKFINSLVKVTYGIRDGRTIKVSDLLDLKYRIPGQNLEQCKVGHLINSINKLLTLYENKKQNLIEIKKELLNTMFI